MKIDDGWHRRQAVAIASTLPDDIDDARKILRLSMELLDGFLSKGGRAPSAEEKAESSDKTEADQSPQPAPPSAKAVKLWLAAAMVIAIIVPSPIFQGNSVFAGPAKAQCVSPK